MDELETRVCVPGEKVFRAGDDGGVMYFIYKGEVEILGPDKSLIATLGEGAFFGERALVEGRKRTGTSRATQFCELYVLKKEAFDRVCRNYPEFLAHVHGVMAERAS